MSANGDDGPGQREIAYRLFAAEFEDADFDYSESDEERAPNYVVTPTGARVNRLFAVGVLTEVQPAGEDILRARIADPTGTFVVYAGQYQPDAQTFLERAEPPAYVAVTGKARTFQPEDSDVVYTSIRPESLNEVDEATRDRWTVHAARQTLERVGTMATALQLEATDDTLEATLRERGVSDGLASGIPLAIDHYGTTLGYLAAMRELALSAAEIVSGEREEVESLALSPGEGGDADLTALAETATLGTADAEEQSEATSTSSAASESTSAQATATESSTTIQDTEATPAEASAPDQPGTEPSSAQPADDGATETNTDESERETTARSTVTGESTTEQEHSATTERTDVEPVDSTESVETADSESPSDATEPAHLEEETADSESPTAPDEDQAIGASAGDTGRDTTASDNGPSDLGDFDGEFELDEDEREEIKSEFGTEFTTGTEVEQPGEADIETPEPDDDSVQTASPANETVADAAVSDQEGDEPSAPEESESLSDQESDAEGETPAEDDLEDAVMDAMNELDDGDGADRDAVIASVVEESGGAVEDVEDAIQEALMNGRCYEPGEGTLKPI